MMGGGGQPGVSLVLPGSDKGIPGVWSGLLGSVGRDDDYGG